MDPVFFKSPLPQGPFVQFWQQDGFKNIFSDRPIFYPVRSRNCKSPKTPAKLLLHVGIQMHHTQFGASNPGLARHVPDRLEPTGASSTVTSRPFCSRHRQQHANSGCSAQLLTGPRVAFGAPFGAPYDFMSPVVVTFQRCDRH